MGCKEAWLAGWLVGWLVGLAGLTPICLRRDTGGDQNPRRLGEEGDYT